MCTKDQFEQFCLAIGAEPHSVDQEGDICVNGMTYNGKYNDVAAAIALAIELEIQADGPFTVEAYDTEKGEWTTYIEVKPEWAPNHCSQCREILPAHHLVEIGEKLYCHYCRCALGLRWTRPGIPLKYMKWPHLRPFVNRLCIPQKDHGQEEFWRIDYTVVQCSQCGQTDWGHRMDDNGKCVYCRRTDDPVKNDWSDCPF